MKRHWPKQLRDRKSIGSLSYTCQLSPAVKKKPGKNVPHYPGKLYLNELTINVSTEEIPLEVSKKLSLIL